MNLQLHYKNLLKDKGFISRLSVSIVYSFKNFLPEINFQNLYSSVIIIFLNLLSLKNLFPIKEIF